MICRLFAAELDHPPAPPSHRPQSGDDITARTDVALPPMPLGEEVVNDYRFLRLSLRAHPAQFLRADLNSRGILRNEALRGIANNTRVRISGLVTCRQRPGSAKGVVFMTIEDESAVANVIVWPKTFERVRPIVLGARFVAITGRLQAESGVIHVVADRLEDLTYPSRVWPKARRRHRQSRALRRGPAADRGTPRATGLAAGSRLGAPDAGHAGTGERTSTSRRAARRTRRRAGRDKAHIAGTTSRPTYITFASSDPSGCFSEAKMTICAPTLSSLLLPGATAAITRRRCRAAGRVASQRFASAARPPRSCRGRRVRLMETSSCRCGCCDSGGDHGDAGPADHRDSYRNQPPAIRYHDSGPGSGLGG